MCGCHLVSRSAKTSRVRKNSARAGHFVELSCRTLAGVVESSFPGRFWRGFCRFSPSRGRFRPWLRCGPHQLGQPDEVVGSGSQGENPTDAGDATVMGLAKAGGRLGPAKHLLNALAQPPTDRIAGMAGRPTRRSPSADWWCSAPHAASRCTPAGRRQTRPHRRPCRRRA